MAISRKKVTVKGFMFKGYIRKKINFTYWKIICISITLEWGEIEEEKCNQSYRANEVDNENVARL